MKTFKILTKVLLTLVFIYGVLGFFILPNIVKDEIRKNAENILKRKVSLEAVSINPFSFEVSLKTLIVHSKGKGRALAGVKELLVNVDPFNIILGNIQVSDITLNSPFLTLHKNKEGAFNFSDLLNSDENASTSQKEKVALPNIIIGKFSIRHGKVNLIDETGKKIFSETLSPINFTLRDFSTMQDHANQLSLHIEIDDGTYLEYRGKINSVEPLRLEGELSMHSGRLYTQWKYFQDSLGFIVADGSLNASFSYTADFSQDDAQIHIKQYKLEVDRLRLQDKLSKQNILRLPSLRLIGSADLGNKEIRVESFKIKDFSIQAIRDKKGQINWLNYVSISEGNEEETNTSEESPWKIQVDSFDLGMKHSSFEEHYAPKAYISSIEALSFGMKDIKINTNVLEIPSFDVNLSQIAVQDLDYKLPSIFSLEEILVHGHGELKAQDLVLNTLSLKQMHTNIKKDAKGNLSYIDYIPYKEEQAKKEQPVPEESNMKWEVNDFSLKNSSVTFKDEFEAVHGLVKITKIDLNVKDLSSTKGSWASSKLTMRINKTAKISINSKLRQSPLKIKSHFVMKNLDLVKFQAFINKKANLDLNSGRMNLDFKIEHDEKTTKLLANMQMNDLNISERKEGKTFFAFEKLLVKDIDFSLNPDQMKIAKINIYKSYARMKVDANKTTNLEGLMIASENNETKSKDTKPFAVFIGKVNFKDGKGEFSDLSLPLPFKTDIHDLKGQILGLGTLNDIKTIIDINGAVDQYGLMKIKGSLLSAQPKVFTDIQVKFQNIDMTNLSPYTGKFIGYKLREGKMNIELDYKINDSQMQGGNRIILKKMKLGEEVDSEDAISAPVGLAIALLKDSDGVIDLDVPVSGDVDSPDFAIGHVVWTAFKNLITGIATAPFRFLGNMLGISAEELENIEFEEGKDSLLPPQKETLDILVKALNEKEMLTLKVAGRYDEKRDLLAMKTALLYEKALLKLEDKTTDLSNMDKGQLDRLLKELYENEFSEVNLEKLEDEIDKKDISSEAKTLALRDAMQTNLVNAQKVSQEDLISLGKRRAKSIISYLVIKGIDAKRLELESSVSLEIQTTENEYIPTKLELGVKQ